MRYILAKNTGKGFITCEDRALGHISGHPGNIYAVSDNHSAWVSRVDGVEKTLVEAQAIVLAVTQEGWDKNSRPNEDLEKKVKRIGPRPETALLPE